jgi:multiple sugar transport system ATP-binding protein
VASVTLNNVWKIYGKSIVAVRDVSLVCKDGEFTALLGPSGCGKTSTLRMIAGLEEITAGTISIGDRVVNGLRPKERDIAMVFETYGLYPHLTVYDNIAFPLRVRKLAEDDIKQRVEKSASVVDLQGILDQYPAALGDGQKQRVSIARAIVREPAVFLFDEPISHLDETLRRRMRTEIKHLQAVLGRTMVYVTHDQIEAMAMADTIVVMDLGVIKQIGTPKQLYNEPANLFVASFIGEPPMNILTGKLKHENGVLEFQSNGFRLPIIEPVHRQKLEAYGKEDVVMGVRPRHIDPYYEPTARSVPSPLFNLEPHGEFNILSFKIGNEVVLVQSGPGFFPHDGQTIHLEFTNNLHFFDVSTGNSILHGEGENGNG